MRYFPAECQCPDGKNEQVLALFCAKRYHENRKSKFTCGHLFRDRNRAGHPEYTSRAEWRVPHAKGRFHYQNRSSAGYHRPITSRPAPACPLNSGSNFRFEGPENGESTNFRTVYSFSTRAFSSRIFLPGSTLGSVMGGVAGCFAADMGQIHALRSEEIAGELKRQDKRVILWLAGGASQFENWDSARRKKPGGPFRAIQTNSTGVQISELLPELSQRMQHTAIIRSLNTRLQTTVAGRIRRQTGRLKDPSILIRIWEQWSLVS